MGYVMTRYWHGYQEQFREIKAIAEQLHDLADKMETDDPTEWLARSAYFVRQLDRFGTYVSEISGELVTQFYGG